MATVLQHKEQVQTSAPAHRWRLTLEQYQRLGELGFFGDQRTELIGGDVCMVPTNPEHACAVELASSSLRRLLSSRGHYVREEKPMQIGDNQPVPDVAVVQGKPSDYRKQLPTTALLVIEVSETTLEFDRTHKASLYASANIPEYWIMNLNEGVLEVYREPAPIESMPFGAGYKQVRRYTQDETVTPLFAPEVSIAVRSLFEEEG